MLVNMYLKLRLYTIDLLNLYAIVLLKRYAISQFEQRLFRCGLFEKTLRVHSISPKLKGKVYLF